VFETGMQGFVCLSTDCAIENGGGRGGVVQLKKKHVPGKVRKGMEVN
jgi:hypothetical protein